MKKYINYSSLEWFVLKVLWYYEKNSIIFSKTQLLS